MRAAPETSGAASLFGGIAFPLSPMQFSIGERVGVRGSHLLWRPLLPLTLALFPQAGRGGTRDQARSLPLDLPEVPRMMVSAQPHPNCNRV